MAHFSDIPLVQFQIGNLISNRRKLDLLEWTIFSRELWSEVQYVVFIKFAILTEIDRFQFEANSGSILKQVSITAP